MTTSSCMNKQIFQRPRTFASEAISLSHPMRPGLQIRHFGGKIVVFDDYFYSKEAR